MKTEDEEIAVINYYKVLNANIDMQVPKADKYNTSTITIPLDFEFTERIFIYNFFGV